MKKVSLVIAVIAFLISGLTASAQPPISITPKKAVTKPAPKQKQSVPTVNQLEFSRSQVGVCLPQPQQQSIIDYQWVKKMYDGKKYTVKLTIFPNNSGTNGLQVIIEDPAVPKEKRIHFFNISQNIKKPELDLSGDWKKLTFTYFSEGDPVTIEIENLY